MERGSSGKAENLASVRLKIRRADWRVLGHVSLAGSTRRTPSGQSGPKFLGGWRMTYQSISAVPLTPYVGAEIGNIDLTKPLSNREVQDLHDAFTEFQVIFFRDQPIDLAQHEALARHFGEL